MAMLPGKNKQCDGGSVSVSEPDHGRQPGAAVVARAADRRQEKSWLPNQESCPSQTKGARRKLSLSGLRRLLQPNRRVNQSGREPVG